MSAGKYLYGMFEDVCFIKMVGDMKYTECATFDEFLENHFAAGGCPKIILDLSDTIWMDSTVLGLIAKISRHTIAKYNTKPLIYSTNEDLNLLLKNMGFDNYFHVVERPEHITDDLKELEIVTKSSLEMKKIMLEAHESLIELSEDNKKKFSNVVAILKSSLKH